MDKKIAELKARIAKLEATIVDRAAREEFLRLPKLWLDDVERKAVPGAETMLRTIEQQLAAVEHMISQYGPNLRIIS